MTVKTFLSYLLAFIIVLIFYGCNSLTEPAHDNINDPQNPNASQISPEIINVVLEEGNSYKIHWNYPTSNPDGYIVERKTNNEEFNEVFKGAKNQFYYKETPNTLNTYTYRIRAYYQQFRSGYSDELVMTYRNEELNKMITKYKAYHQHISNLIAFSSDLNIAATVTDKINIINPELPSTIIKQLDITSGLPPYAINFNDDGSYFIEITSTAIAKIWETRKWYIFKELHLEKNYKIVQIINNDYLICSGADNYIDIYSLQTDSLVNSLYHDNIITNLVYNKIGNAIISINKNNEITIWSLNNFEKLLEASFPFNIDFVSLDTDNYKIIVISSNSIHVLNYNDLQIDFSYQRTSHEKILNAYFEKNTGQIVFNTEKNVWLLNTSNFTDENMLTFPTKYEYMFAHKSLNQFFIGGNPLIGFEILHLKGYWSSNLD